MLRGCQDAVHDDIAANPTLNDEREEDGASTTTPYVIKESPIEGLGMIANMDFEFGDLIIQERPFILCPSEDGLGPESESRPGEQLLLSLQCALDNLDDDDARNDYMNLANIYPADECDPVLGIFKTNRFDIHGTGGPEDDSANRNLSFAAVFKDISRINHSCCPNVIRYWCASSFLMHIYAARSIQKGMEIVTSYCDPLFPWSKRRALLFNAYKTTCNCAACISSDLDGASDANRLRIQNIQDNLPAIMQWAINPFLPDDLLLLPSLELLKLIKSEGLEGTIYYARVLRHLWYIYFVLDDFGAAGFYGRMLRAWKIANGVKKSVLIQETHLELELMQLAASRRRLRLRKG